MNLGLLITTCKHYFTNIPNLIKNIEECNFPKENVLIVSGQENENSTCYENNIKIVRVNYTGLHLTGVIYLSENIDLFTSVNYEYINYKHINYEHINYKDTNYKHINYWIILPDTVKLNKNFYINIMKYYDAYLKDKEIYSLPFIHPRVRPSMDMGIIHIKHIYNMSDYLKKIKKVEPYDILKLKTQLIYDENTILGMFPTCPLESTKFEYINSLYPRPNKCIINQKNEIIEKKIIINNKLCNEVYFSNIDMYKYQRNFRGPHVKLIMEL